MEICVKLGGASSGLGVSFTSKLHALTLTVSVLLLSYCQIHGNGIEYAYALFFSPSQSSPNQSVVYGNMKATASYHIELLPNTGIGYYVAILPARPTLRACVRLNSKGSITCHYYAVASSSLNSAARESSEMIEKFSLSAECPVHLDVRRCGTPRVTLHKNGALCLTLRLSFDPVDAAAALVRDTPKKEKNTHFPSSSSSGRASLSRPGYALCCSFCRELITNTNVTSAPLPSEAWGEVVDIASCHHELDQFAVKDYRAARRGKCLVGTTQRITHPLDMRREVLDGLRCHDSSSGSSQNNPINPYGIDNPDSNPTGGDETKFISSNDGEERSGSGSGSSSGSEGGRASSSSGGTSNTLSDTFMANNPVSCARCHSVLAVQTRDGSVLMDTHAVATISPAVQVAAVATAATTAADTTATADATQTAALGTDGLQQQSQSRTHHDIDLDCAMRDKHDHTLRLHSPKLSGVGCLLQVVEDLSVALGCNRFLLRPAEPSSSAYNATSANAAATTKISSSSSGSQILLWILNKDVIAVGNAPFPADMQDFVETEAQKGGTLLRPDVPTRAWKVLYQCAGVALGNNEDTLLHTDDKISQWMADDDVTKLAGASTTIEALVLQLFAATLRLPPTLRAFSGMNQALVAAPQS